jgi:hypothetical protein
MNNTIKQLENLYRVVPDAPALAADVMCRIQDLPAPQNRLSVSRTRIIIGALAASILICAASLLLIVSPSPQLAFGQVIERTAKYGTVRYDLHYPDGGKIDVDYRTVSAGGNRRSEFGPAHARELIITHNSERSPDWDLRLRTDLKYAEFELVDKVREEYFGSRYPENPITYLQQVASHNVVAAPNEMYEGKKVRVFVNKPGDTDKNRTTRVLVDWDTGMPLCIETADNQIMDHFEWNPPLDDSTYSTTPPPGYTVTYNLIRPLSFALDQWAAHFNDAFPDQINQAALESLRRKEAEWEGHPVEDIKIADAIWGFSVPKIAAQMGIDLRYYGTGKHRGPNFPRSIVVAVETAPGSGEYDAMMTDYSRSSLKRSELP